MATEILYVIFFVSLIISYRQNMRRHGLTNDSFTYLRDNKRVTYTCTVNKTNKKLLENFSRSQIGTILSSNAKFVCCNFQLILLTDNCCFTVFVLLCDMSLIVCQTDYTNSFTHLCRSSVFSFCHFDIFTARRNS